jgi:hypothetical protein
MGGTYALAAGKHVDIVVVSLDNSCQYQGRAVAGPQLQVTPPS